MRFNDITNNKFIQAGYDLLASSNELLILVNYPYAAGNKDFFVMKSKEEFDQFLLDRKPKEAVTLFRSMDVVLRGKITNELLVQISKSKLAPKGSDWIMYIETDNEWYWVENKEELLEYLSEYMNKVLILIEDPDYLDKETTYYGYQPDPDGKIRPGAY